MAVTNLRIRRRRGSRLGAISLPFLMKDVVLLAVSFYLLKQDVVRVAQLDLARHSKAGALVHSRQE